jgi:hypothetical protein
MFHHDFHRVRIAALVAVVAMLVWLLSASAFAAGMSEEDVPATSIVPAEGPAPAATAPAGSPSSATKPPAGALYMPAPKPAKAVTHHAAAANSLHEPEIEPAEARLKVLQDSPVYSAPAKSSKHIEQLTREKFVNVTGSTHYFLQVKLKSGQTGYIEPSSVDLVKPTDKIFLLSHDAGVLDKPNRWAKRLAEVHQGHNVHVVGVSLNYLQIRMKNGLQGFIPQTALE